MQLQLFTQCDSLQHLMDFNKQEGPEAGAWSKPPIRDTSCGCHPLTGVPYLRFGPRRARAAGRGAGGDAEQGLPEQEGDLGVRPVRRARAAIDESTAILLTLSLHHY